MTNIVERLRSLNADFLHEEAADEIERLRTEVEAARVEGGHEALVNALHPEFGSIYAPGGAATEAYERGRREGIEAAMVACGAVFTDTEGVWANGFTRGVIEAQASIRALLTEGGSDNST